MKTCKKCESTDLYKDGRCKSCVAARNALYYKNNKTNVIERYYENRGKRCEYKRNRYAEKREQLNASNKEYRLKNSDAINARLAKYREINKDVISEKHKIYRKQNPEIFRAKDARRRMRIGMSGGRLSKGLIDRLITLQSGKCPCCGNSLGSDFHVDHILPLALGGGNVDSNIQLLRAVCNIKKRDKHPVDYMRSKGFLL